MSSGPTFYHDSVGRSVGRSVGLPLSSIIGIRCSIQIYRGNLLRLMAKRAESSLPGIWSQGSAGLPEGEME